MNAGMRSWFPALLLLLVVPTPSVGVSRLLLAANGNSLLLQNRQADKDDLSRMRNRAMLRRFVRNGYLVPMPVSTRSYYLHGIVPEYHYARPWTKLFLTRLSRQFHARFGHRMRLTSLVRTEQWQLQLARWNGNAADATGDLRSSHLTGATVDISKRFMSPAERQWVRKVLYSLRQQGYLYAVEEFEQPVFHVMVYRSYPRYVKRITARSRARHAEGSRKTPR